MEDAQIGSLGHLLGHMFQAHPWHGIPAGDKAPKEINAFIEIVPTDTVKYELDKETGHLSVDRPQLYSNVCPSLYGFIPQTYCGKRVAQTCEKHTGREGVRGDADPIDICVLSEKNFAHGHFQLRAIPIGGMRMIDDNEADDKIIAVLEGDASYGEWRDIKDCTDSVLKRLEHYFLTYKDTPTDGPKNVEIAEIYGASDAHEVIQASIDDYKDKYKNLDAMAKVALGGRGKL